MSDRGQCPPLLTTDSHNTGQTLDKFVRGATEHDNATSDDILDFEPDMSFIFKPQPHMIRSMDLGGAVFQYLFKYQLFAKHPAYATIKTPDTWTHGIMCGEYGGGFTLPNDGGKSEKMFLKCYMYDVCHKMTHYLLEQRTSVRLDTLEVMLQ